MTLEGLSSSKLGKIVVKLVKDSPDGGKSSSIINFLSAALHPPKWQCFLVCGKHATKGSSDVRYGRIGPALIDSSFPLVSLLCIVRYPEIMSFSLPHFPHQLSRTWHQRSRRAGASWSQPARMATPIRTRMRKRPRVRYVIVKEVWRSMLIHLEPLFR